MSVFRKASNESAGNGSYQSANLSWQALILDDMPSNQRERGRKQTNWCKKSTCIQAVGEVPEAHRGPALMDVDPPSTSQETTTAQAQSTANGKDRRVPRWKERGLQVLKAPHVRPLEHQEVLQTIKDGAVVDWDHWEAVVDDAVRSAAASAPFHIASNCKFCALYGGTCSCKGGYKCSRRPKRSSWSAMRRCRR
jgi:hypothetical protein